MNKIGNGKTKGAKVDGNNGVSSGTKVSGRTGETRNGHRAPRAATTKIQHLRRKLSRHKRIGNTIQLLKETMKDKRQGRKNEGKPT